MLVIIGVLTILTMITVQLAGVIRPTLKSKRTFNVLSDFSTSDRIFRIFQYGSILLTGLIQKRQTVFTHTFRNFHLKEFQKLSSLMSRSRKILRFLRAPLLVLSLHNREINLSFHSKTQAISSIETVAKLASDCADAIFFFSDHYGVFFALGILEQGQMVQTMGKLGDIMWVCCSSCIILASLCMLARNKLKYKSWREMLAIKEVKTGVMDIFAHSLEVWLGVSFMNPGMLGKEAVGVMAIASTVTRLCKIVVY